MSTNEKFSRTPEPPYYAVIFTSQRSSDASGYDQMAVALDELAAQQTGYLGQSSARDADGFGITVSDWRDEDCVKHWKNVALHKTAQRQGRERWYSEYDVRVSKVERAYAGANASAEAVAGTALD
ncbi:MAG TPA: antibiotic biosynthesis monooxygenase [Hyphomicrobium sp.]|nr:antibiotic biosynthesis monooxygenase [Hyphomicrobium sp.]